MFADAGGARYTVAASSVQRHVGRGLSRRVRRRAVIVGWLSLGVVGLLPSAALAFSEFYGGGTICGSNCFVQSAGAHTFIFNEGFAGSGKPKLACQLFNSKGANAVEHGAGFCIVSYFGGEFVTARVYNQGGFSVAVQGFAET